MSRHYQEMQDWELIQELRAAPADMISEALARLLEREQPHTYEAYRPSPFLPQLPPSKIRYHRRANSNWNC